MNDLPFEWEEGEVTEQAYVTINGQKYYVTPATYSGGTSLSANHLNQAENKILERVNGTILWTNQNPTANFVAQTITLSSSDYDILEFIWRTDLVGNLTFSEKVMKGKGTQFDFFSTAIVGRRWCRRILYVSDTSYSFNNCYKLDTSSTMENDNCVPLYVIGYKTGLFGGQS